MARFNEILVGRYNRQLQKLFSMKGGPPAPQLGTEITPAIPLFLGREARYLEGWSSAAGGATPGPAAANSSAVRLRNPINSGVIAVVEKIMVAGGAATDLPNLTFMFPGGGFVDLPLVGFRVGFDPRSGATNAVPAGGVVCTVTAKNNNAVRSGSLFAFMAAPINQQADFIATDIEEIVLLPDCAIDVTSNNLNQCINVNFQWRERPLEDSEKT